MVMRPTGAGVIPSRPVLGPALIPAAEVPTSSDFEILSWGLFLFFHFLPILDASRRAQLLPTSASITTPRPRHGAVIVARPSEVGAPALTSRALHGLGLASAKADAAVEALRLGACRRAARQRMEGSEPYW